MEWRYVDNSEIELLQEAYDWEKEFPTFYKDANIDWRPTFEEALKFYQGCILYGLFEDKQPVGLIFIQRFGNEHLDVHLALKRGERITAETIEQVRDDQFRQGVKTIQVWVMKRNKPLRLVLKAAGFDETGMTRRQGHSHSKVLHWTQMTVARSF
jgi:hypothetical protein